MHCTVCAVNRASIFWGEQWLKIASIFGKEIWCRQNKRSPNLFMSRKYNIGYVPGISFHMGFYKIHRESPEEKMCVKKNLLKLLRNVQTACRSAILEKEVCYRGVKQSKPSIDGLHINRKLVDLLFLNNQKWVIKCG